MEGQSSVVYLAVSCGLPTCPCGARDSWRESRMLRPPARTLQHKPPQWDSNPHGQLHTKHRGDQGRRPTTTTRSAQQARTQGGVRPTTFSRAPLDSLIPWAFWLPIGWGARAMLALRSLGRGNTPCPFLERGSDLRRWKPRPRLCSARMCVRNADGGRSEVGCCCCCWILILTKK